VVLAGVLIVVMVFVFVVAAAAAGQCEGKCGENGKGNVMQCERAVVLSRHSNNSFGDCPIEVNEKGDDDSEWKIRVALVTRCSGSRLGEEAAKCVQGFPVEALDGGGACEVSGLGGRLAEADWPGYGREKWRRNLDGVREDRSCCR